MPFLSYAPGSICSLRPETSPEEVDTFLKLNKLEDEADRPMIIDTLNDGTLPIIQALTDR